MKKLKIQFKKERERRLTEELEEAERRGQSSAVHAISRQLADNCQGKKNATMLQLLGCRETLRNGQRS